MSLSDITFLLFRYEGNLAAIVQSIELAVKKLCCQRHEKHLEQLAPEKIECKSASVKQLFHSPDEGKAICELSSFCAKFLALSRRTKSGFKIEHYPSLVIDFGFFENLFCQGMF